MGGVRPASSRAPQSPVVGRILVSRRVDPVRRTLVWSLAWAEWVVAVSVAGGQGRILKYFYLLFFYKDAGCVIYL